MNGQVKADARLSELEATSDAVLVLEQRPPEALNLLQRLPQVQGVGLFKSHDGFPAYRVLGHPAAQRDADGGDLCPAIYNLAREQDWPLRELRRDVRTLETVFNELATAEVAQ
jgi:hypothetical protein